MKISSLHFNNNVNSRSREEWLMRLVEALRPSFHKIGHPIPDQVRITCGWPSKGALSRSRRTVGECWCSEASADQTIEIFISPCLGESVQVAAVTVHELVHATGATGHRGKFPKIAKAMGLMKPWRATRPTAQLQARLNALIASRIGPYPHAKLDTAMPPQTKDSTRMHKLVCPNDGYIVRTTAKWIEFGLPTCPCGTRMEVAPALLPNDGFAAAK